MRRSVLVICIALAALAGAARAQDWRPSGAFVAQGGVTVHGDYSVTGGATWPWKWQRMTPRGEWTGYTEVFASHWNAEVSGGHMSFTQVGVLPVFRFHFDHGHSRWFAEGGIGATYMDRLYRRDSKQFSTRFNFIDTIGAGRSFGAHGEHEIGIRLAHISNGGIKKPNPGENFLQLRYARNF